jgi:hypothetical protein
MQSTHPGSASIALRILRIPHFSALHANCGQWPWVAHGHISAEAIRFLCHCVACRTGVRSSAALTIFDVSSSGSAIPSVVRGRRRRQTAHHSGQSSADMPLPPGRVGSGRVESARMAITAPSNRRVRIGSRPRTDVSLTLPVRHQLAVTWTNAVFPLPPLRGYQVRSTRSDGICVEMSAKTPRDKEARWNHPLSLLSFRATAITSRTPRPANI